MEALAKKTDNHLLKVFDNRLNLNPDVLNTLELIEKASAKQIITNSDDGQVLLNHIQVPHKKRVAWDAKIENDQIICYKNGKAS